MKGLSSDRRFILLYEAALTLATIALACAGYRTVAAGHHLTVLKSLPLTVGADLAELSEYLLLPAAAVRGPLRACGSGGSVRGRRGAS